MRRHRRSLSALLLAVAALSPLAVPATARAAAPRSISFEEAIQVALKEQPAVRVQKEGVNAAEARVGAAKASRYPRLRAEANLFAWNEELKLDFGIPLPGDVDNTLRDQITSSATVTIVQPITGLLALQSLVGVERSGLGVASAEFDRARLDTASRTGEAYLRLLQARALSTVASTTVQQIEAQLKRAKILEQSGVLGKVDVLRLESARQTALAATLRATAGVDIAEHGLVLATGLPADTDLDVTDNFPTPPPALKWTVDQALAAALANRPELKAAEERKEQAHYGKRAAQSAYVPQIAAIGTYQHTEGQGTLSPENAYFGGLTLQWDVWEWGRKKDVVDEAAARERQADAGLAAQRDGVAFEVRRAHVQAATTWESISVAQADLTAAEEAYRIQTVRYQQGAATTTDLIDAETDIARARSGMANARYEYYIALVALARAVGELPTVQQ